MSVNGSDIETAAEAVLTASKKVAAVQVGRNFPTISKPGINVAVLEGDCIPFGSKLKRTFKITVVLVVKNVVSESERRKTMHPIQDHIIRLLWGSDLGLAISGILPGPWRETTNPIQLQDGLTVFECDFSTSTTMEKEVSPEEAVALEEILAFYSLQPSEEQLTEASAEASDSVQLESP